MTSIGTLVAFLVVSIGVMVLRRTAPDLPRGFKVPGYPVTPILSILGCLWIIIDLRPVTIACSWSGWPWRWSSTSPTGSGTPRCGIPRDRRPGPAVSVRRSGVRRATSGATACDAAWRGLLAALRAARTCVRRATVVPAHWPPGVGRVDAEYQARTSTQAPRTALRPGAARWLPAGSSTADVRGRPARSVHAGRPAARSVEPARRPSVAGVVGSSAAAGPLGRVSLGSVGEHLLHACSGAGRAGAARVPVRRGHGRPRVTAAFAGDARVGRSGGRRGRARGPGRRGPADRLVRGPARAAAHDRGGAAHRGRGRRRVGRSTSRRPSSGCSSRWRAAGGSPHGRRGDRAGPRLGGRARGRRVGRRATPGGRVEHAGPLERVFLGSRASKIVRNAPVPVVALPARRGRRSSRTRRSAPEGRSTRGSGQLPSVSGVIRRATAAAVRNEPVPVGWNGNGSARPCRSRPADPVRAPPGPPPCPSPDARRAQRRQVRAGHAEAVLLARPPARIVLSWSLRASSRSDLGRAQPRRRGRAAQVRARRVGRGRQRVVRGHDRPPAAARAARRARRAGCRSRGRRRRGGSRTRPG